MAFVTRKRKAHEIEPFLASYADEHCYTDASLKDGHAGLGIYWQSPATHAWLAVKPAESIRDINRAELLAIFIALLYSRPCSNLHVFTDSQVAIDNITFGTCESKKYEPLAHAIRTLMATRQGRTTLRKVKGHAGVWGNEAADTLARCIRVAGTAKTAKTARLNCCTPGRPSRT